MWVWERKRKHRLDSFVQTAGTCPKERTPTCPVGARTNDRTYRLEATTRIPWVSQTDECFHSNSCCCNHWMARMVNLWRLGRTLLLLLLFMLAYSQEKACLVACCNCFVVVPHDLMGGIAVGCCDKGFSAVPKTWDNQSSIIVLVLLVEKEEESWSSSSSSSVSSLLSMTW